MNKGGRPRKEVDWEQVDRMCAIHCTGEEQAALLNMHYETLNTRCHEEKDMSFLEYFKEKSASGKMSLRRKQYTSAMDGNTTMLVWLGKNWLGQTDKTETEIKELPTLNITLSESISDDSPD